MNKEKNNILNKSNETVLFEDIRSGDKLSFSYMLDQKTSRSFKGVCLSKTKEKIKILSRIDNVLVVYNFFVSNVEINSLVNIKRNKKSYFLINKMNNRYRKIYSDVL